MNLHYWEIQGNRPQSDLVLSPILPSERIPSAFMFILFLLANFENDTGTRTLIYEILVLHSEKQQNFGSKEVILFVGLNIASSLLIPYGIKIFRRARSD